MSTVEDQAACGADKHDPFWLPDPFWSRLNRLEGTHVRLQARHEALSRELSSVQCPRNVGVLEVWQRYCEVIRELDMTTAELEVLRTRAE